MSHRLTKDHIVQLNELAAQTGETWEEVLEHALSEYRGLVGVAPPAEGSRLLNFNGWVSASIPTTDASS